MYILLLLFSFFATALFPADVEKWQVSDTNELDVLVNRTQKASSATILFIHGGPFDDPMEEAILPRTGFFQDLSEAGFNVVAPSLPLTLLSSPNIDYRDLINSVARLIKEKFNSKIEVISHSFGGHWAGQTFITNKELSKYSQSWINISGTTHHAAGDLRRSLKNPIWLDSIPYDSNRIIKWSGDNGILDYNVNNEKIINVFFQYYAWSNNYRVQTGDRYIMDQVKFHPINNPLVSEEINKQLSVHYHANELPKNIPILVIHPLHDGAVTVDVGYAFYHELLKNNLKTNFFTVPNSAHNWMKNDIKEKDENYNSLMKVITNFMVNREVEVMHEKQSKKMVEEYLSSAPHYNFMKKYMEFSRNEAISFATFSNENNKPKLPLTNDGIENVDGINLVREKLSVLSVLKPADMVNKDALESMKKLLNELIEANDRGSAKWIYYINAKNLIIKTEQILQ